MLGIVVRTHHGRIQTSLSSSIFFYFRGGNAVFVSRDGWVLCDSYTLAWLKRRREGSGKAHFSVEREK